MRSTWILPGYHRPQKLTLRPLADHPGCRCRAPLRPSRICHNVLEYDISRSSGFSTCLSSSPSPMITRSLAQFASKCPNIRCISPVLMPLASVLGKRQEGRSETASAAHTINERKFA
ncbi:hypothetical protein PYCCODRAFT_99102 [Trametes coccinea BRFM310]|uniref:Uncharacterized protein n=1 Tax=Trametes coccinea (strain BRFM310) TaxID=1353009 RepID=A0A1Y2ITR7_TRAC3|nr:hypothetical protein PYCCODRAFT_99102 [Trametes coccinea BRFM310]